MAPGVQLLTHRKKKAPTLSGGGFPPLCCCQPWRKVRVLVSLARGSLPQADLRDASLRMPVD